MLKKRIIFVLFFTNGKFHLSRNFKLQSVGDAQWLFDKFKFQSISQYIDEIVILNVDRTRDSIHPGFSSAFVEAIQFLMKKTFCPLTIGGGIITSEQVSVCFNMGADKVLFNTAAIVCPTVIEETVFKFGTQAVIGAVDYKNDQLVRIRNGSECVGNIADHLRMLISLGVGEILINNIDADGTGQGFNFDVLNSIPPDLSVPLIICGGAGKPIHFQEALLRPEIDAVASGNLFNFIGNGFEIVRRHLLDSDISVRAI
jgi:cyclase